MERELRHFEAYCKGCNTLYYFDQRLPRGLYNFVYQAYGKTLIMRFSFTECPFCTFDEDFEAFKRGTN